MFRNEKICPLQDLARKFVQPVYLTIVNLCYYPGGLQMQHDKLTSLSKRLSRTLSATLMTFFPEKSIFILQSAVQGPLQPSQLRSHPPSHITEPSQNPSPAPRPQNYLPQHIPHRHEPLQKRPHLRACPAHGRLLVL